MALSSDEQNEVTRNPRKSGWGPKLFAASLVALLAFFYWLLIYSGGVIIDHG